MVICITWVGVFLRTPGKMKDFSPYELSIPRRQGFIPGGAGLVGDMG